MPQAADGAAVEKRGLLGQIEDFGQSALHTAIESPINGAIQFVDHAAHVHLPELDIIGAPKHNSMGTKIGAVVGAAADLVALSIATGGVADILGGAGLAGGIGTAAATGALYGGVFTQSDNNSKHFFEDRLTNGAISGLTFAAMGGAAKYLGSSSYFAVQEVRSLGGSLAFGALTGAAGGAVGAEATAVLKDHKALPSGGEFVSRVGTQALFGATFAGLSYGYNVVNGPLSKPTEVESGRGSITTINDSQGQPVGVKATIVDDNPAGEPRTLVQAVKMGDGTWSSSSNRGVNSVTASPDGSVHLQNGWNETYNFEPGRLTRTTSDGNTRTLSAPTSPYIYENYRPNGEHEFTTATNGSRVLDTKGNTLWMTNDHNGSNGANMEYDANGQLSRVRIVGETGPNITLDRAGTDTWTYEDVYNLYSLKGTFALNKDVSGTVNSLTFAPEKGTAVTFGPTDDSSEIVASITKGAQDQGFLPRMSWIKASPNGDIVIKATDMWEAKVNGNAVTGEFVLHPGDKASKMFDVGDDFMVMKEFPLQMGRTLDGRPTLNGFALSEKPILLEYIPKQIKVVKPSN